MIFDILENAARYSTAAKNLDAAFKFLQANDLAALPLGRLEIDGDHLYAIVQEYTTKPLQEGLWEAHRRYIDVQYLFSGEERMGVAHLSRLQAGEYLPDKDFLPLQGAGDFVDVFPGAFVVFFPEDAHMPGLSVEQAQAVRKIVLKVRLEEA